MGVVLCKFAMKEHLIHFIIFQKIFSYKPDMFTLLSLMFLRDFLLDLN